jgi:hypothetical protein
VPESFVDPTISNSGGGGGGHCPNGDGLYCGSDGIGGDSHTLYRCAGGNLSVVQMCSGSCQQMPAGQDDRCASGDGGGGSSCPYGDGLYCGGDGIGGDSHTLYDCSGGNLLVAQVCSGTCQNMAPGQNDRCAGSCPYGDGLYCGGDGITGDPATLYRCSGGALWVAQACSGTCQKMPPGQNDRCAPCPYGDGLYCGGDGITGNGATLYRCSGGALYLVEVCSHGCRSMPAGQNDLCN